ncbi:phage portal protein [Enterococcus sp. DIV1314a]|uniref:phage portal protein n=1 Tax=Enterococcus sp. DIV1314a TaxID=2774660 RepID=UPI003F285730
MGVFSSIKNFFVNSSDDSLDIEARPPIEKSSNERTVVFRESVNHVRYKSYALSIAISRIANAVSLCGFQTYIRGKPEKGDLWWRLNYEPNQNQNQTDFFYSLVHKMVYNSDGALVIQAKSGDLIVAESFTIEKYAFLPNVYSNIILPGGLSYQTKLKESDVIHLKYNNSKVKAIVDSVYEDYGKLLNDAIKNYKRGNAIKLKLLMDAQFDQFKEKDVLDEEGNVIGTEYDEILDDLFQKRFGAILSDKDSITPLEDGLTLSNVDATTGNTKSGAFTSRDITSIFDDIVNQVADAFLMPRGIFRGDVADNEGMRKSMIDDAVRPFIENIQTEINRKKYGKDEFYKGNKLKISTDLIYTKDPIAFANAAEAYLRIGVYCVNDILEKLGEEIIDEEWAWRHYVTKNYENINNAAEDIEKAVSNMMRALGRGEPSEKNST